MIFSDLDGTLLDHDSYDWTPARPALEALARQRIPVVLCSSKTRAEMARLASAMGLDAPLLVENGGGIWLPASWRGVLPDAALPVAGGWIVVLGARAADLRVALGALSIAVGVPLRGFSAMDAQEVAARTGLPLDVACLAREREFSEPFVAEAAVELAVLDEAARARGLRVTRGGRFFHLIGPVDKGDAVRAVRTWLGSAARGRTPGFGDALNDLPLLQAVDQAVIVPRPDGTPHPDLVAALPHASVASAPGPAGWNAAVLAWIATGGHAPSRSP
jgi:mannosyl-3-phosphoglycerate phosphatase